MAWTDLKTTRPYDSIPGPARIDQFAMAHSTFGIDVGCKNCGQPLKWDLDTDRSQILEILAAIEMHQCDSALRLRHAMLELADSLRRGPDGKYALVPSVRRETADLIESTIRDLDPAIPQDDD